jgi:hypothetical protein
MVAFKLLVMHETNVFLVPMEASEQKDEKN